MTWKNPRVTTILVTGKSRTRKKKKNSISLGEVPMVVVGIRQKHGKDLKSSRSTSSIGMSLKDHL